MLSLIIQLYIGMYFFLEVKAQEIKLHIHSLCLFPWYYCAFHIYGKYVKF